MQVVEEEGPGIQGLKICSFGQRTPCPYAFRTEDCHPLFREAE